MKVSVAISITIHILVFLLIYHVNTNRLYNNDITIYFDDTINTLNSDLSVSQNIVDTKTIIKEKTENKKEHSTESLESNNLTENNETENSTNIETGEYIDAIENGVINGVKLPLPQYPALAKKRGLSGTTIVDIFIEKSGVIYDVKVVSSSGERILDNAVKETVLKRWRLPPANKSLVVRKIFEFDLIN